MRSRHTISTTGPVARSDLVITREGDRLVLTDPRGEQREALDLPAALVWTYCDGRHSERAITLAVAGELGQAIPEPALREAVSRTLERFAAGGLLTSPGR